MIRLGVFLCQRLDLSFSPVEGITGAATDEMVGPSEIVHRGISNAMELGLSTTGAEANICVLMLSGGWPEAGPGAEAGAE